MNVKLLILLTYALSDKVSGSSKPSNPSCLPDCSCQNKKHSSNARIEIDCRNAHYKRMPSPLVYAEDKDNHFTPIRLTLTENRIEHLDVAFLNQWKTLEVLSLSQNKLKSLSKSSEDETSMANLKSLDLSSNSLQVLHTFVLAGFPLLRTLNLSNNQIHSIMEGAFILPSLHELDLSHNQMTEVSSHLFETSPRLVIIRFAHNKVSRLLGNSIYVQSNFASQPCLYSLYWKYIAVQPFCLKSKD